MSYLLVALALANNNLPSEWASQSPEDIATAVHIIEQRQEAQDHG